MTRLLNLMDNRIGVATITLPRWDVMEDTKALYIIGDMSGLPNKDFVGVPSLMYPFRNGFGCVLIEREIANIWFRVGLDGLDPRFTYPGYFIRFFTPDTIYRRGQGYGGDGCQDHNCNEEMSKEQRNIKIMPPRMWTRSAGRPVAESRGGRTSCSYKEFIACNPKEYDGKGGVVVLTRWIEKMESVQDMSGCSIDQKVKYTTGSFVEEFCPSHEMQKLETELWNHVMVGAGHAAYTDRFHELARLVPHLVTPKSWKIKRYMYSLAPQMRRMVATMEPKTMQKAV
ncbi:hypothetical protein Tco_0666610 [Tanacetum coccineum]